MATQIQIAVGVPTASMPFAASSLPFLYAWYKADSLVGLNNNDLISSFPDSGPNGYTLTAAGGTRPSYLANAVNGLPAIHHSGASGLSISGIATQAQPFTITIVSHLRVYSGVDSTAFFVTYGAGAYCCHFSHDGTNNKIRIESGTWLPESGNSSDAFHIITGTFNGANSRLYIDTSLVASGNAGSYGIGTAGASGITFGGFTGGQFGADTAEAVVFIKALSDSERGTVETYLKAKYGL